MAILGKPVKDVNIRGNLKKKKKKGGEGKLAILF